MEKTLVSVIVPNYNHAAYLDERIQSVLNQTYSNFEIIILDDVSSDNSREVIEKYRDNPHVSHIVFNEKNSGSTFKQWHKGFSLAKGNLIWIAESDDACEPTLLEKLVHEFDIDKNCVLAFSRSIYADENLEPMFAHKKINGVEHWTGIQLIKMHLAIYNIVANASSAVFSKDIALSIDDQYTKYKGAGDQLFWIEICEHGNVAIINEYLNYFRHHGTNTTAKCNSSGQNMKEVKAINDYLLRKGLLNQAEEKRVARRIISDIYISKFNNPQIKGELLSAWEATNMDKIYGLSRVCLLSLKHFVKNTILKR